jgi:hypothetical protein
MTLTGRYKVASQGSWSPECRELAVRGALKVYSPEELGTQTQIDLANFWTGGALKENLRLLADWRKPGAAPEPKEVLDTFHELARFVRHCGVELHEMGREVYGQMANAEPALRENLKANYPTFGIERALNEARFHALGSTELF